MKKRILFFAEAATLAHVMRPVTLAQTLNSAHYEIWLACQPRYLHLFPNAPANRVTIHSIESHTFIKRLAMGKRLYSREELDAYIQEDLQVIDEVKPDLVIGDFRLSLAISAPLRQVAYGNITNSYWSPNNRARLPIPEHPMNRVLGSALAQACFNVSRPAIFAWHAQPLNQLRHRYGLSRLGHDLRTTYSWGDHTLYADIPELSNLPQLPPNHHYLGPVIWSPPMALPQWWQDLPTDKPIVYLNLGSSGRNDLIPLIVESLITLPITLAVATLATQATLPPSNNLFVADYLPGDQLAARAQLTLCNGGSPATQQALAQSCPVLGIVSNMDQHLNMMALEEFGAGIRLRTEQLTPQNLKAAVTTLLSDPGYKQQAREISRLFGEYPISKRFPELITTLLA